MTANKTTSFYLIRHAQSEMNTNPQLIGGRSNESPLTPKGIEQAKNLGRVLRNADLRPEVVFASPAKRTQQTAEYSLGQLGVKVNVEIADEIQELAQGEIEGQTRVDVYTPEVVEEINRQGKDFRQPGGESMNDVGLRMHNWVSETTARLAERAGDPRTALVYTHGGAITYLVSRLENWSHPETYAFQKTVENTSVSRIDAFRDELIVELVNVQLNQS